MKRRRLRGQERHRNERDHRHAMGRCLLAYRDRSGMTTREIGNLIGVSQVTISNWCTSARMPIPDHLRAYLRVMGVSCDQFTRDMETLGYQLAEPSPLGPVWWTPVGSSDRGVSP